MSADRRAQTLLALGALAGLAAAMAGLTSGSGPGGGGAGATPGAAAIVNGTPIAAADLERALAAAEADRRRPDATLDRARLLERLIDEELLLQHALDLGLARADPQVRGQLVRGVIDAVVAESAASAPSADELRRFYEQEGAYFARPGRRRVRRYYVRGSDAAARARAAGIARALRAGTAPADAGDPAVPVPDALLPSGALGQYLGPTLAQAAERLEVGAVSAPIRAGGGMHVLVVVAADAPTTPPFEDVRAVVEEEYRRRRGEDALRRYLTQLRAEAEIVRPRAP